MVDRKEKICKIIEIIEEIADVIIEEVRGDIRFKEDLGMTDLDILELALQLDDKVGVEIYEIMEDIKTVDEIINRLEVK